MTDGRNGDLGREEGAEVFLRPLRQPMPGQFRTVRRVALLAILLRACHGSRATLPQLHVLNWAVRSRESRATFLSFIRGFIPPDQAIVRFDPTLPRAIQFAVAEGIVLDREPQQQLALREGNLPPAYRVRLTTKGSDLADEVAEAGLMADERFFLESIGEKVTQDMVKSLLNGGR